MVPWVDILTIAASIVAIGLSVVTAWRNRRVPRVVARWPRLRPGDVIVLENRGGRPAHAVDVRVLNDPDGYVRPHRWNEMLPVPRIDEGTTFGLPATAVTAAPMVLEVEVEWFTRPAGRRWRRRKSVVHHLSRVRDQPDRDRHNPAMDLRLS